MAPYKGFNTYRVEQGVAYIEILNRQGELVTEAMIDAADLPLLLKGRCRCSIGSKNLKPAKMGYIQVYRSDEPKNKLITLHRLLMNPPAGMVVDHINGNTFDNRRCNLRVCTQAENLCNRRKTQGISQYKGVTLNKATKKPWQAQISSGGQTVHLGTFATEVEAARAYDAAARRLQGEFAYLNFPDAGK